MSRPVRFINQDGVPPGNTVANFERHGFAWPRLGLPEPSTDRAASAMRLPSTGRRERYVEPR
jgi:hypothetical protein